MRHKVLVSGYSKRLSFIPFVKLIEKAAGESLGPSKRRADELLEGRGFELSFADRESAVAFVQAATDLGAAATLYEMTGEHS